jgi:hypothetical protein
VSFFSEGDSTVSLAILVLPGLTLEMLNSTVTEVLGAATRLNCYNLVANDAFNGTFGGFATPESSAATLVCPRCGRGDLWLNC